ncbi:MAG: hypothetical protein COA79_10125 [Planctomycetota bacterium]|nr:MAG: hypothetical protein COA79_10125 [Planctomycetota bacterium]
MRSILAKNKGFFPVEFSVIDGISSLSLSQIEAGHTNLTTVPPDHNIQLILEGRYSLEIDGHQYSVKSGDIIYYEAMEKVFWKHNNVRVKFYSLVFTASQLDSLPWENRVFPGTAKMKKSFHELYACSIDDMKMRKPYGLYGHLLILLEEMFSQYESNKKGGAKKELWWSIEKELRRQELYRITLLDLCDIGGFSKATINRSCRKCLGKSPMDRLRQIRMETAKAFLMYSGMNVSMVAQKLGYGRIHEFSREFKEYYKIPPRSYLLKNQNL